MSSNLSADSYVRHPDKWKPDGAGLWGPQPPATSTRREWVLPAILFLATLTSTSYVGLLYSGAAIPTFWGILLNPFVLVRGLPFSFPLIAILLAHEMGHYLACRYYGIRCTPPFFLPLPVSIVGTLGAFIRIKSPFTHRRALFDVGIAGPLAGFVFVIPSLVIGIGYSQLIEKGSAEGLLSFGEPLLFRWVGRLVLGYSPEAQDMIAHPIAMAAWFGLLATCLNLLPIWQLDGGHITYALLGRERQKRLSILAAVALVLVSFLGWPLPAYLLFGLILLLLGVRFRFYHPPTLHDGDRIGGIRLLLALVALLILIVSFTPIPFYLS